MDKGSSSITRKNKIRSLLQWSEPETNPTVLPRSKTGRLALKAKLANIDAERAVSRAYKIEISRTQAIAEAMFKSGKALRYSLISSVREIFLRVQAARRQFEPGFRRSN